MVHSIELLFDPDTEAVIHGVWQELSCAGLHGPAPTSRPHLTMVVAEEIDAAVHAPLSALEPRFPFRVIVGAPMVFGRSSLILVRVVVPSMELLEMHAAVLRISSPHISPGPAANTLAGTWTPHVTLARRVQPSQLAQALRVRAVSLDIDASVVGLRHWDGNNRVEFQIT